MAGVAAAEAVEAAAEAAEAVAAAAEVAEVEAEAAEVEVEAEVEAEVEVEVEVEVEGPATRSSFVTKASLAAVVGRVEGARGGREVGRDRVPGQVGVAGAVERDAVAVSSPLPPR